MEHNKVIHSKEYTLREANSCCGFKYFLHVCGAGCFVAVTTRVQWSRVPIVLHPSELETCHKSVILFWVVAMCSLVNGDRRFGGQHHLPLQASLTRKR
jgi:hypothetical protein